MSSSDPRCILYTIMLRQAGHLISFVSCPHVIILSFSKFSIDIVHISIITNNCYFIKSKYWDNYILFNYLENENNKIIILYGGIVSKNYMWWHSRTQKVWRKLLQVYSIIVALWDNYIRLLPLIMRRDG